MANRLPIRWRLTLWYVVVLAVTMALAGVGLYFGLRYILYDSLDSNLETQAAVMQQSIVVTDGVPTLPGPSGENDDDLFVRLTDTQGHTIPTLRENEYDDVPPNPQGIAAALDEESDIRWLESGDERLRVLTLPITREAEVEPNTEVAPDTEAEPDDEIDPDDETDSDDIGESDDDLDSDDEVDPDDEIEASPEVSPDTVVERGDVLVGILEIGVQSNVETTLSQALRILFALAPIILIFAGLAGLLLARRALQPIDQITRTAESLQEQDLSQRITNDLPDDELGRLAATLNAMLDRIESAFIRQREFTAEAAHELRTPLALMRSQIELALAQTRDPRADREILQALNNDLDRLTRLSSALLELARGDARGFDLDSRPVDLPEILGLIVEQYTPRADELGVRLVLETTPVTLQADGDLLVQLIVNLMDNALCHAPEGSQVELGCRPHADQVVFWVADQGAGIPAEHLPHLFDRFYRVEPDRDRQRGGAGLGLSICKAIVDAHHGTIVFESEPGQGTTVRVTLPGLVA